MSKDKDRNMNFYLKIIVEGYFYWIKWVGYFFIIKYCD